MFNKAYGKKPCKRITLYHDTQYDKWYLVSQYTGELCDVSLKSFIQMVKDFRLPYQF